MMVISEQYFTVWNTDHSMDLRIANYPCVWIVSIQTKAGICLLTQLMNYNFLPSKFVIFITLLIYSSPIKNFSSVLLSAKD